MALCQRAGNSHAAAYYMCDWQMARALGGQTRDALSFDDEHFDEAAFLAQTADMPYVGLTYHARRALHAVLLGDPAALGLHADRIAALHGADPMTVDEFLCIALACAWRVQQHADSGSTVDMAPLLAELASHRQWLAARAADQPYNFLHLLRLVEAEEAWALGDSWKAATTFDAAVAEAQSRRRPWHRALITERAGLFHIGQGLAQTGRKLLADACDLYEDWGAAAKVTQMQRAHPFLQAHDEAPQPLHAAPASSRSMRGSNRASSNRASGSGGVSSESLDLMGVLRASQALSSETSLERLTARVAEVLASLSGATKALVLLWSDGQWWLLAQGEALVSVAEAAQRGLLAASVVAYAERTGQALVVDDACSDDRFARDPYFTGVALCSLLVAPITGQGGGHAMLVLENRQGRAAFNAQRLDAVMLIAGQLAVSLANAQLYENLEQRVQARTRELQQMQAQLVTTARRAGMAEIANNVLHNVGNVLNSINVSANVVRRTIGESRAQGLARAVQLMNEHEADLGRFISEDTRGKNLLPYLNELVAALQAERNETLEDLQRLVQSVDHISYVVATQQSHAGPSSVLETAQPQELLEEALRLSEQPLAQYEVTVVRHYEPVAATLLDKPRLLQILVNLIRNAAQAMESVPEASRLLTLATLLVPVDGGQRLRITVQDSGEGIAAENLTRVFAHGFTTRSDGHGFGLHSSALAAMEMGAKLGVHSDGPGRGAVFTLEIPMAPSLGT
jgi:signal transduction histidine kinase